MRRNLGKDFERLWIASGISNIGDGLIIGAVPPLLASSITSNEILISTSVGIAILSRMIASIPAGVWVDRHPRKELFIRVSTMRGVVVGVLSGLIATGHLNIAFLWILLAALSAGEAFADAASTAMLPEVVEDEDLAAANSLLFSTLTVGNDMIGVSLGPWLYSTVAALPFFIDSISFFIAASVLVSVNVRPAHRDYSTPDPDGEPVHIPTYREDIREGIRFLAKHPTARAFVLAAAPPNMATGAILGTFVLYAQRWLRLDDSFYGLLLFAMAVGLVIGTFLAERMLAKFSEPRWILVIVLCVEGLCDGFITLTNRLPLVIAAMAIAGVAVGIFISVGATVRQLVTPKEMLGRMQTTYSMIGQTSIPIGTLLGGIMVRYGNVRTPLLFSLVVLNLTALVVAIATIRSPQPAQSHSR